MGRSRRGKVRRRGHDCRTALLWCGGDSVWAVWVVEGLNKLVRRGKVDRNMAIAGGVLGTGDPVIWRNLHGHVAYVRGAWTWTRGGTRG